MNTRRTINLFQLALLLGCGWLVAPLGQAAALEAQEVRDLRYGQVLYHLYQQKYFSAITDLLVAQKTKPVSAQGENPKLLLGALYLSYGMHDKASDIFNNVLDAQTLPAVHDRAWYYIAKLRYLNGHLDTAERALRRIKGALPADREAERLNLLANTYLQREQYDKAITVLQRFEHDSPWQSYARFNLGVALIRAGQADKGIAVLDELGTLELQSANEELRALRDKANLAMGFANIGNKQTADAIKHFSRVRLEGPLSNKALLGIGWARNLNQDYAQSLTPWLELQGRARFDAAVQEALLAIPYTYEKMNNRRLALDHYKLAIEHFADQLSRVDAAIAAVKRGELVEAMRPANRRDETSLPRHTFDMPQTIAAPYLSELMASNGFQQAYKNFQDLLYLRGTLRHWRQQLPAYELMLEERKKVYRQRLPKVAGDERINQIRELQQRRDALAERVARIQRERDAFALANEEELLNVELIQDIGDRLKQLRQRLHDEGGGLDAYERLDLKKTLGEAADKYQLLRGLLYWQIHQDFVPRLWQVQQRLEQLNIALQKASKARRSLAEAANEAPGQFDDYQNTIDAKRQEIENLLTRLDASIDKHAARIERLALQQLNDRRHQLENYHVRARFSLARLLDTLANEQELSDAP